MKTDRIAAALLAVSIFAFGSAPSAFAFENHCQVDCGKGGGNESNKEARNVEGAAADAESHPGSSPTHGVGERH